MIGMKDWLQNKSNEIASSEYNSDFYDLPQDKQDDIYNEAIELYIEHNCDQINLAMYEALRKQ